MNGGTCDDGINSFTCYCALGYTDINCSTDINDCDPNPCKNGAACNDGISFYTCECVLGYTDVNCSTAIDPCFYQTPCGVNEECTNTDLVEIGYFCNCSEGFMKRKDVCMASSSVGGSLRFDRVNGLQVLFTDSLGNPQSENYLSLEQICYKILRDVLMGYPNLLNSDWDVVITGFSPGSVIAEFMVMVFDTDSNTLKDQSSAVEAFLGQQDPGVWQAQDGSGNLNVLTITAFGEICLTSPCVNGMCLTTPGDIDYTCRCNYGFTGQHCEIEVTCSLPFHPFSHVVRPKGVYRGDDFITIQCDEGQESVVWQCNGTTGTWKQLADLDCEPGM
ncbi:fibropellin-1-like [Lytechinus variegatus]|uniref:fibropellin-1-like n=1 Tax=Lytechinus variegatus TaxID=7654 RepID=UPI001BB1CE2D|nr:fibropellin-1-like [Lytechinus variegatus]